MRGVGLLAGFAGMLYAARTLGPERLGFSGAAFATAVAASMGCSLCLDTALVRHHASLAASAARVLQGQVLVARTGLALFVCLLVLPGWWLWGPSSAGWLVPGLFLMILAFAISPGWVLQSTNRIGPLTALMTVQSLFTVGFYTLVLDDRSVVGTDLVLGASAAVLIAVAGWVLVGGDRGSWARPWAAIWSYLLLARANSLVVVTGVLSYGLTASDLLLIGWLAPAHEVGVYRAAGVAGQVVAAFSSLYTLALYPRLIAARKAGGLDEVWRAEERQLLRLWVPAVPIVLAGVAVLAPVVFGSAYAGIVWPALWLAAAKLLTFWCGVPMWSLWADRQDSQVLRVLLISALAGIALNLAAIITQQWALCGAGTFVAELLVLGLARRAVARRTQPATSH